MNNESSETQVIDALREQLPVRRLPGVRISNVIVKPEEPFDLSFDLIAGSSQVRVLGEIKGTVTPRILEQIAPWIRRLKYLRDDVSIALIVPTLSPQAQDFCIQKNIDFIDLAGNISINVPSRLTLQRTGQRERTAGQMGIAFRPADEITPVATTNPFSGRSSRVLRVFLEKPRIWTLTEVSKEIDNESARIATWFDEPTNFRLSLGAISKTIASLEEQLLVRRRGTAIVIPEPDRLLFAWAEKYKERYRWRLRSSFQVSNPFGASLTEINKGLSAAIPRGYAFTGACAATVAAPYIDIDTVDVFVRGGTEDVNLRQLKLDQPRGPGIRFIYPYDTGVFMYCSRNAGAPVVSAVQAYLDLYARGGRDAKQANYLFENVLLRKWTEPS